MKGCGLGSSVVNVFGMEGGVEALAEGWVPASVSLHVSISIFLCSYSQSDGCRGRRMGSRKTRSSSFQNFLLRPPSYACPSPSLPLPMMDHDSLDCRFLFCGKIGNKIRSCCLLVRM